MEPDSKIRYQTDEKIPQKYLLSPRCIVFYHTYKFGIGLLLVFIGALGNMKHSENYLSDP